MCGRAMRAWQRDVCMAEGCRDMRDRGICGAQWRDVGVYDKGHMRWIYVYMCVCDGGTD